MIQSIEILIILGSTGLVFLVAGIVMRIKPPKEINTMYGYRTTRSMKSQSNWDFAQRYSAVMLCITGVFLSILGIVLSLFNWTETVALILSFLLIFGSVAVSMIFSERAIKWHEVKSE